MAINSRMFQKVCDFCGKTFIAQKTTTRYCSHSCNSKDYKKNKRAEVIERTEKETQKEIEIKTILPLKEKEILTVAEAATYMGLSRQSIYNMIHSGVLKAAQITERLSLIRRKDIDAIFDNPNISKTNTKETTKTIKQERKRMPITEVYSVADIKEKYKVKESWIFIIAKKNKFPRTLKKGMTYFSKEHVDKYFAKKTADPNISDWYTVEEIKEKYNMTTTAVYTFVSEKAIPKKKEGRAVYYSQKHVDELKSANRSLDEYYTVPQAMEKFSITRDQLYYYVKYHNIPKLKIGKTIKILSSYLDKVLNPIIE